MFGLRKLMPITRNLSKSVVLYSIGGNQYALTGVQKRMLVWSGKFKTLAEVPDKVPYEVYQKAQNKVRIKLANWMIVLTLLGCAGMVWSGKKAKERGESVHSMNLEWHKAYNEAEPKK